MTPAEPMHVAEHRPHQSERALMLAAAMRQHRLAYRQGDIAHDPHHGPLAGSECAHPVEHAVRRVIAPGGGERHHPVRQRERREAIADAGLRLVGDLGPALADIDAETFQTKQHRGGVLHVDVEVGLRLRQRRPQVAETFVIEIEHGVELAPLQMKQRAVPPQMMQQVVAALPVALQFVEPRDAFCVAPFHLHDVGDRMRTPDVAGIDRDRGTARRLGDRIVAALLGGKAMAGEQRAVSRKRSRLHLSFTRSIEARMSPGRPSQKLLKCARRSASTSCGCSARISSQMRSEPSRSPSTH